METKLYYTIGEVSRMLDVAPSVLRFWETQFDAIRPTKNKRGARSYTEKDIDILRRIHYLTRDCGYTLEGARDQMHSHPDDGSRMEAVRKLTEVREFLIGLKESL